MGVSGHLYITKKKRINSYMKETSQAFSETLVSKKLIRIYLFSPNKSMKIKKEYFLSGESK